MRTTNCRRGGAPYLEGNWLGVAICESQDLIDLVVNCGSPLASIRGRRIDKKYDGLLVTGVTHRDGGSPAPEDEVRQT